MTTNSLKSKLMDIRIGPLPLPVYAGCAAVVILAGYLGVLPKNMLGGFGVILTVGWLLGTIGSNLPVIKNFGGPAVLSLLVPSVLVYYKLIDQSFLDAGTSLMKQASFLYFYIACLICGSIFGMHRKILIQGFIRILPPIFVGSVVAILCGLGVGYLLGEDWQHTLFYIITPVMAGGVGEGVIPLSSGYATVLNVDVGPLLGQMMPAVVIGNLFAIGFAAVVNRIGEVKTHLSGQGQLVKIGAEELNAIMKEEEASEGDIDLQKMAGGFMIASTMFISGMVLEFLTTFPGAVMMIIATAVVKYLQIMPKEIEMGSKQLYKFIAGNFTFPLMAGLGLLYIPLESVVNMLTVPFFVIIITVVFTLSMTGWYMAKLLKMYEVEASIIAACHSGMGGTGDVAILTTAGRMNLMPFAQVSTRLGGAITVIAMIALLKYTL